MNSMIFRKGGEKEFQGASEIGLRGLWLSITLFPNPLDGAI